MQWHGNDAVVGVAIQFALHLLTQEFAQWLAQGLALEDLRKAKKKKRDKGNAAPGA